MQRYSIIEHTADIGIAAGGPDLAAAFKNAAYGMFSLISDLRRVRKTDFRIIELQENSLEDMLFAWLNQLIYIFDAEQMLFRQFDIQEFDGNHLKALCSGEKVDPERHHLKRGIKAATYHLLRVDRDNNRVQVIFDILIKGVMHSP
jgi:SHS2 domain-containing protein